jgi:2-keto-4-pentenoate hydratase/2-oxohepta-3-ene-1,7-dioic acid hydratase in catechol pathway
MYHAIFTNGKVFEQPISKVVCVGRNYAEHAKELNNPVPDEPILFIKPESSVVDLHKVLEIPQTDCHYETELAILIGAEIKNASSEYVSKSIVGVGLALDLTRRALQSKLKDKSHPWEVAKSFDGACPLSQFIPLDTFRGVEYVKFSLSINNELKQEGDSRDMLNSVVPLIAYMSRFFTLRAGDVILTGTPKGVGVLNSGDQLSFNLNVYPEKTALTFLSSTKAVS